MAQGALWIAEKAVQAASAVVEGPGYESAKAAIAGYQFALNRAQEVAHLSFQTATATLEGVTQTQDALISGAEGAVTAVQTVSQELQIFEAAKAALEFSSNQARELLAGLQAAVDGLSQAAEFGTYNLAKGALDVASHHTELVDLAHQTLDIAQASEEATLQATKVIIDELAGIFRINKIEMHGDLRGMIGGNEPFSAHIQGIIGGKPFDFRVEYRIGAVVEFLKLIFEQLLELVKSITL